MSYEREETMGNAVLVIAASENEEIPYTISG